MVVALRSWVTANTTTVLLCPKEILIKKEVSTIHISRDNPNTAKPDAKIRKDFAVVGLLWDCFLPSFIQFIVEISREINKLGKILHHVGHIKLSLAK